MCTSRKHSAPSRRPLILLEACELKLHCCTLRSQRLPQELRFSPRGRLTLQRPEARRSDSHYTGQVQCSGLQKTEALNKTLAVLSKHYRDKSLQVMKIHWWEPSSGGKERPLPCAPMLCRVFITAGCWKYAEVCRNSWLVRDQWAGRNSSLPKTTVWPITSFDLRPRLPVCVQCVISLAAPLGELRDLNLPFNLQYSPTYLFMFLIAISIALVNLHTSSNHREPLQSRLAGGKLNVLLYFKEQ